ncbi:hypothetical protein AC630_20470 [Bradyrhizobium sp. AS23.2]|nr:hypothetical protein AC630_20470 [Bradyrhizobium sp. AS23.2]
MIALDQREHSQYHNHEMIASSGCNKHTKSQDFRRTVIARSPCDEAIQTARGKIWIASLRSQ